MLESRCKTPYPEKEVVSVAKAVQADLNTIEGPSAGWKELDYDLSNLSPEDAELLKTFPEDARKRVLRKVGVPFALLVGEVNAYNSKMDFRIVAVLSLLYFLDTLDRSNIANVLIEGMDEDLQLEGTRYNVALCVFYVPYILVGKFTALQCAYSQKVPLDLDAETPKHYGRNPF